MMIALGFEWREVWILKLSVCERNSVEKVVIDNVVGYGFIDQQKMYPIMDGWMDKGLELVSAAGHEFNPITNELRPCFILLVQIPN